MASKDQSPKRRAWNYHPQLPISVSPIMNWPPRFIGWLKWISSYWLVISSVTVGISLQLIIYLFFHPSVETMKTLSLGWIAQIWLRNIVLLSLAAGGLHLWFYILNGQDKTLKYDPRDLARNNGTYMFRDQVKDNMFWCLASGVTFWTMYEVFYWWAASNGYAPLITVSENPIWFVLWFALIPVWSGFHFYWIHRALHWPPLYRMAHAVHHRNVNIGPWSGISMHPVEHIIYFSSFLIHFIVPSHPLHVLFHAYFQGIGPAFSHSGFESVLLKNEKWVKSGDFFHQLHHRYFECNYGTSEIGWDKLFGTFHDGTEEATQETKARKRQMHS